MTAEAEMVGERRRDEIAKISVVKCSFVDLVGKIFMILFVLLDVDVEKKRNLSLEI